MRNPKDIHVLVACEESQTMRSKTFPGIAKAIAKQWGAYLLTEKKEPIVYIQERLFERI